MPRSQRIILKASLLGGFWLMQAVLVYLLGAAWFASMRAVDESTNPWGRFSAGDWFHMAVDPEFAAWCLAAIVAMTALQAVFLWPVRAPAPAAERGWPIWLSLAVAGACMAVLSLALIMTTVYMAEQQGMDLNWLYRISLSALLAGWLAASWLLATPLLIAFCRRPKPRRRPREALLGRVASLIFLGTMVETAAIIPLDILIRRRESCYCLAGTFWALTLCGSIGIIVLGPAILLPLLARRRKRWYAGRCDFCGYDMSGCPTAAQCPECGAGWRTAARPATQAV